MPTVCELKIQAKAKGIRGFSKMRKSALMAALDQRVAVVAPKSPPKSAPKSAPKSPPKSPPKKKGGGGGKIPEIPPFKKEEAPTVNIREKYKDELEEARQAARDDEKVPRHVWSTIRNMADDASEYRRVANAISGYYGYNIKVPKY